mmetsp:Transcript_33035/g.68815  ORF Transcript_33035/g.68815 Transcript_33035/m.68815 type:complete len:104 (+) Transcript_33035:806-1117(+)
MGAKVADRVSKVLDDVWLLAMRVCPRAPQQLTGVVVELGTFVFFLLDDRGNHVRYRDIHPSNRPTVGVSFQLSVSPIQTISGSNQKMERNLGIIGLFIVENST